MPGKNNSFSIERSSELIDNRIKKMSRTYIGSALCVALATAVDALVAGAFIGTEALAAVAAAAPFLAVDGILHCLLGYGIDKLMIRAIGRGNRKEADRIFGTVLITVFTAYLIVVIPAIRCGREIISANLADPELIEPVYQYCWPRFLAMPLLELCLCIERAFRVDGRARLFALRGIVASVLSVLLDFLLVPALENQVQGLAWASVIGALLGYTISLSHFFSRKRTVTPDFSVLLSPREMWEYIKADIRLGSSATWDEVLEALLAYAQISAVASIGGAAGLAVWSVYKALRSIVLSLSNGISASVSVHTGLLYGENDYDGVRYAIKKGSNLAQWYCIAVSVAVLALAGWITDLYKIMPESRQLCIQCLRTGSIIFPALGVMTVFSSYLPAVNKNSLASFLLITQKGLPYLTAAICTPSGMQGFITEYVLAVLGALIVIEILLKRNGSWFVPETNPETINSYSIQLDPERINAVSDDIYISMKQFSYPGRFSLKSALVAEESLNCILKQNPQAVVRTDIKIDRHENDIQFTIIENGKAYNPIPDFGKTGDEHFDNMEDFILMGLTVNLIYDRVLDLNRLSMFVYIES